MRVPGLIRTPAPLPASSYATPVAYFEDHYGPKRPYAPRDEWFSVINQAVDDTFGADHTVRMQSGSNIDYNGSGEALPQHGSRRHGTGLAGDFSIMRPDGSIVPIDSPESLRFMHRASELGITGMGAGTEYMGPTSYHMDLVTPDPARGEGHVWGSVARANAPSIVPLMTGQDSPSRIAGDAMDALGITMNANRPPQPAQPQGLLGFLGMQRQDQSAGGETAMPFYQRPTFQDFAGKAAQAFNTLRLRPDDQLGAVIKDRREGRQEEARASRTTDWLSQQPGSEAYVEAIRGGADPGAVLMEYQAARTKAAASPDQTSAIQNYEYMLAQGEDPAAARERAFGGGVNIDMGGGTDVASESAKYLAQQAVDYSTQGQAAATLAQDLDALSALADVQSTGPLAGRFAEMFPDLNNADAVRNAIVKRVGPSLRAEGSGSTSDIEYQGMLDSLGSLKYTPEANRALISIFIRRSEFMQQRGALARQAMAGQITTKEYLDSLTQLENNLGTMPPELMAVINRNLIVPASNEGNLGSTEARDQRADTLSSEIFGDTTDGR